MKSIRQRQISYDISHMWNLILKNDTNELTYKTETDLTDNRNKNLQLQKRKHGEGRINQVLRMNIYTLLYIR